MAMRNAIHHRHSIRATLVLGIALLSLGCQPPHTVLHFARGGHEAKSLKLEFDSGDLKLKLVGWVGYYGTQDFLVHLHVYLDMEDSASFRWQTGTVRAWHQGELLAIRVDTLVDHVFYERDKGAVTIEIKGSLHPDSVWEDNDQQPVRQNLSILVDSAIVWKGEPVVMDTIRAFFRPPPSPPHL